jgi:hypothetical protein
VTDPILLSVAEVAALTGLSRSHIRRHAPLVRVGHRTQVPVSWVTALTHHGEHGEETDERRGQHLPAGSEAAGWDHVPAVGGPGESPEGCS